MLEKIDPLIALVGYGEAASTFARSGVWGARARGWDVIPARRAAMTEDGVTAATNAAEALTGATTVLSLVTADQALRAAQDYASFLSPGTLWCDMNSVAPQTKRAAHSVIAAAGGSYVDVAILAPVMPARLGSPLLVSGTDASRALTALGFTNVRFVGGDVGRASTIKMIRSVMIKGIEALTAEMMAAAEAGNVAEEVLASLDASERPQSWSARAAYNLERMAVHGVRRAVEMEESAKTLEALGVDPVMTRSTIQRQREAAIREEVAHT